MREQVRLLNVFQDNVLIHDILLKRFLRSSGKASGGGSLAENKFLVTMPLNTEKRSLIRCGEAVLLYTRLGFLPLGHLLS